MTGSTLILCKWTGVTCRLPYFYLSIRLPWPVTDNLLRRAFGLAVACEDLEVPGVPGVQTGFWAGQGERSHVKDEARWPGRRDPGEERQGEPRAQPEDCAPGSPARDQETMVSVSLRRLGAVTAGTSANSIDTRLLNLLDKGCHIILQLEHLLPKSYLAPLQTKSKVCVRGCYVKLYMYICIYMEKSYTYMHTYIHT